MTVAEEHVTPLFVPPPPGVSLVVVELLFDGGLCAADLGKWCGLWLWLLWLLCISGVRPQCGVCCGGEPNAIRGGGEPSVRWVGGEPK